MSATPPLIDSTIYFLSGEERCLKRIPVEAVMSTNWGTSGVFCAPRRTVTIAIPRTAAKAHVLRCLLVTETSHRPARSRELLEHFAEFVFQVLVVAKSIQLTFGIRTAARASIQPTQAKVRHDICRIVLHRALQQRHGFVLPVRG